MEHKVYWKPAENGIFVVLWKKIGIRRALLKSAPLVLEFDNVVTIPHRVYDFSNQFGIRGVFTRKAVSNTGKCRFQCFGNWVLILPLSKTFYAPLDFVELELLTWEDNSPTCWEAGVAPLQTFMCRTCLSSLALALSLSLNRLSASRSLSSSSCSRLCCLCKRASSPMVDPTLASRFPPSLQRGRHTPPPAGTMVSCNSSSRMESCLITAPWKDIRESRNPEIFTNTQTSA